MRFFISYKDGNSDQIAARVKEKFSECFDKGVDIFLAKQNIRDLDNWYNVMWNALFKSDCFIIIVDEAWISDIESELASYARLEAEYIAAHFTGNNVYIIPVETEIVSDEYKSLSYDNYKSRIKVFPDNINKILECFQWPAESVSLDILLENIINKIRSELSSILSWRPSPVLFISSVIADSSGESASHLEYFGAITRLLAISFSEHNECPVDCVIKVTPSNAIRDDPQVPLIQNAISKKNYYRAIIIAPFETQKSGEIISNYIKLHNNIDCPIFTIDKTYHKHPVFKNSNITPPCGVMNNWKHGGEAAAELFNQYLQKLNVHQPRLFVVDGLEGGKDRVDAFCRKISSIYKKNNCQFWGIKGNFSRTTAKSEFSKVLQNSKINPGDIHGVFCANDEMALGVREAIVTWESQNGFLGIIIVGYDGIDKVKQLIDAKDHYILNTIDVDLKKQVSKLTECVMQTIRGSRIEESSEFHEIKGHPYINDFNKQQDHIDHIFDYFVESGKKINIDIKSKLSESRTKLDKLKKYIYQYPCRRKND